MQRESLDQYLRQLQSRSNTPSLRVIFVNLEEDEAAEFGYRLSLQQDSTIELLERFAINPHFVQFLFGKPDYLAPFFANEKDKNGTARCSFVCQFPRWYDRSARRSPPCSIFIGYDEGSKSTTYVVSSVKSEPFVNRPRQTLQDFFTISSRSRSGQGANEPFLVASILARESLFDAEIAISKLRKSLYSQLEIVDSYASDPFDRSSIRQATTALHDISQQCAVYVPAAEKLSLLIQRMNRAHQSVMLLCSNIGHHQVENALNYIEDSINAQKRWIVSYNSRKDVAMTVLFQLITHQNSETNMSIALATQKNSVTNTNIALVTQQNSDINTQIAAATLNDSAVMKFIAIVTMLFLPPTVVTSFFGMSFFPQGDPSEGMVSRRWWIFWAVAVPLTCMVVGISFLWFRKIEIHSSAKIFSMKDEIENGTHPSANSTRSRRGSIVSWSERKSPQSSHTVSIPTILLNSSHTD